MEMHTYFCKDGRLRCYDPETHKVTSYPRKLMEEYLGRPLEPYEQIHHVDENPQNNDISNLEIINIGEHQRMHVQKYFDKEMICSECGKTFTWTAIQQSRFNGNRNRKDRKGNQSGPFCSKHCAGSYSRKEQLRRNALLNARKFGETLPMATPSQAEKSEGVET